MGRDIHDAHLTQIQNQTPQARDDLPAAEAIPATAATTTATTATATTGTRYDCRIPIRMTPSERSVIGKKACALNKSISRYLVEAAVQDKPAKPGQAGQSGQPSDPARLRYLQVLFQDAADKTKALLASPLFVPKNAMTGEVRARLEEAAYLLKALAGELARRLS